MVSVMVMVSVKGQRQNRKWAGCACGSSLGLGKPGLTSVWRSSGVTPTEVTLPLTPRRMSGVHATWRAAFPGDSRAEPQSCSVSLLLFQQNTLINDRKPIHLQLPIDPQAAITVLTFVWQS